MSETEKSGHPLPGSGEARHDEIPEGMERRKGRGDDSAAIVQPELVVDPDGTSYPAGEGGKANEGSDIARDQRAHQDRGQSDIGQD